AISAAVSKRTDSAQGSAMGILNGYDSLGRAIGPSLGGFMLDRGLNFGYYTAIVICFLALLILIKGAKTNTVNIPNV
ncbi:MAG: MFS transporter, partial [Syntrophomonadaceae bacterium]|nr:MFS transporter [Syntrophomonadaceae bacterium]